MAVNAAKDCSALLFTKRSAAVQPERYSLFVMKPFRHAFKPNEKYRHCLRNKMFQTRREYEENIIPSALVSRTKNKQNGM